MLSAHLSEVFTLIYKLEVEGSLEAPAMRKRRLTYASHRSTLLCVSQLVSSGAQESGWYPKTGMVGNGGRLATQRCLGPTEIISNDNFKHCDQLLSRLMIPVCVCMCVLTF